MSKSKKTLKDTGERMIPAYHKSHLVYGEHIVRYEAAAAIVHDKVVLDIASGSGYGTAHLALTAKKVFGVDVSKDAIAYSKMNYGSENVDFLIGNGTKIPLDDNAVDIVVSFETLEHIEDYNTFMIEIKRVLKEDGLLILSTPNDIEFPETNHFHVHEFEHKELNQLVNKYFKYTTSYFQATWLYNALLTEKQLNSEWRDSTIETLHTAPIGIDKSIYFYMLCANRKINEKVKPIAAISEHWSERTKQEYEQSIRDHIEEQGKIMSHQSHIIAEKDAQIQVLQTRLGKYEKLRELLKNSPIGSAYRRAKNKRTK